MNNATAEKSLLDRTIGLFTDQLPLWEQCRTAYNNLSLIKEKEFLVNGVVIKVQWNPGRLISTTANVDANSIKERPCFLCEDNRPKEQNLIEADGYSILVNPFPIFPAHYTITNNHHKPQSILPLFTNLLFFTKELGSKFAVFYNGPRCGASAPDHAHFQAGQKDYLPIVQQLEFLKTKSKSKLLHNTSSIRFINDTIRKIVLIEGSNAAHIQNSFELVYSSLTSVYKSTDEPMMNILSLYNEVEGKYELIAYIREKHRPACYFAAGEEQILLSPATLDCSGLCIVPRKVDFDKLHSTNVTRALREVFVSEDVFAAIENELTFRL